MGDVFRRRFINDSYVDNYQIIKFKIARKIVRYSGEVDRCRKCHASSRSPFGVSAGALLDFSMWLLGGSQEKLCAFPREMAV